MIRVFMIGMSANKGGVESYISNLSSALPKTEFEIIYSMPEMVIDGKLWHRPVNRHNYPRYCSFWKRFYRETKIDVVYFNTCDMVSIDALRFARKAGIPVRIIHAHSTGNQQAIGHRMSLFHRLSERINRKTLDRYATHLFACSQAAGEWMFDGRPFLVIKNGINIAKYCYNEQFRKKIRASFHVQEGMLVGVVGRLAPQKNPLYSAEILKNLVNARADCYGVFVGDGALKAETEKAIKSADLDQRIFFVGAVDNVNEWMSAVDCILMPSLFEGLPFVLLEAQAAGVPCVVSSEVSREADVKGKVDFVDLDEPLSAWVEAVIHAAEAPRFDAMKELITAGYSIEDSAGIVADLLKKAVGDGGAK